MLTALEAFVRDSLVGLDVRQYRKIFEITDKLFAAPSLKAAIQYAVLNALGEETNIHVYQFLGGALKEIETDKTVGIDTIENRVSEAKKSLTRVLGL